MTGLTARFSLSQALLGHTDTVTCATASLAYHIIVSGSRDRTCIIWDLNKLSFLTQLRGHRAPVSALCINELTVSSIFGKYTGRTKQDRVCVDGYSRCGRHCILLGL